MLNEERLGRWVITSVVIEVVILEIVVPMLPVDAQATVGRARVADRRNAREQSGGDRHGEAPHGPPLSHFQPPVVGNRHCDLQHCYGGNCEQSPSPDYVLMD